MLLVMVMMMMMVVVMMMMDRGGHDGNGGRVGDHICVVAIQSLQHPPDNFWFRLLPSCGPVPN